jgi:hypothetical protein
MKKLKDNKLENRDKIYNFISKHPGVHQRSIIKKFKLSEGTIKYHLNYLTKKGFISCNHQFGYSRFYPTGEVSRIEKDLIGMFHQEIPKSILIYLIVNFGASLSELSKNFEKDVKTIDYHIKKLIKLNIIEPAEIKNGWMVTNRYETQLYKRNPHNKEKIYRLKYPYVVYYFLKKNKNKIFDKGLIKDLIVYADYFGKGVQPNNCESQKTAINEIVNCVFEIFPHPYYCSFFFIILFGINGLQILYIL